MPGFLPMPQCSGDKGTTEPAGRALNFENPREWTAERDQGGPFPDGQGPVMGQINARPEEDEEDAGDHSLKGNFAQSNY